MTDDWIDHAYDHLIEHLKLLLPNLMIDSRRRVLDEAGKGMLAQVERMQVEHRRVLETLDPMNPDADEAARRIHELDAQLLVMLDRGLDRLRELGHRYGSGDA
jgi:nucleotide-binding universal stress UspA family protein